MFTISEGFVSGCDELGGDDVGAKLFLRGLIIEPFASITTFANIETFESLTGAADLTIADDAADAADTQFFTAVGSLSNPPPALPTPRRRSHTCSWKRKEKGLKFK